VPVSSDVESVGDELAPIPEEVPEKGPEKIPEQPQELPRNRVSTIRHSIERSSRMIPSPAPPKKSETSRPKTNPLEILIISNKQKNTKNPNIKPKDAQKTNEKPKPRGPKSILKDQMSSLKKSTRKSILPVDHKPTQAQILRDLKVKTNQERLERRETLNRDFGNLPLMEFFRKRVSLEEEDAVRKLGFARESSKVGEKIAKRRPTAFVRSIQEHSIGRMSKIVNEESDEESDDEPPRFERRASMRASMNPGPANTKVSFSEDPIVKIVPDWNNIRYSLASEIGGYSD
jgi:hypothetical protein